ncbi:hypothetical protein O3M35_009947 [Rhynocoris fuscipes]|uniref:Uncharacterized protein n=1 Tax=Rhynocoris fuscipes TaxID=488301 RepID=A0AAW1CY39_9HEMI
MVIPPWIIDPYGDKEETNVIIQEELIFEGRTGFGHSSIFSDMQASEARTNLVSLASF